MIREVTHYKNGKEIFYLTVLTVYYSALLLGLTALNMNSTFAGVLKYIKYVCYLCAIIKILMDCYDKKSFLSLCVVAALVLIIVLQMDKNTYLYYLLMIIAARDVNIREIIKRVCVLQGIVLAVFILASQMGLVENYFFLQNGRNRYALGFIYTTYAPTILFFFMMAYCYLRKERMRIYEFAIIEAVNYWLFAVTDSRVCFYLSTIFLAYVFFMRYFWQNREKRIRKNRWLIIAPSAACVGSILLHVFYNPEKEIWVRLNTFLMSRLSLGKSAIETYGITLFGQKITWIGHGKDAPYGTYNYVDNAYVKVMLEGGIVLLILVIAAYTYLMYLAIKTNNYYMQTILLFIIIFCITEARIIYLSFNPFLFWIAAAWRTKDMDELNRKETIPACRFRLRTTQVRLKNRC